MQVHEDVKHGDILLIVSRATSRYAATASLVAGHGGGKGITIRYPLRICDPL